MELDGGRTVVRELRSQAPVALVPRRGTAARTGPLVVHLVGSAATPLGGDDVGLDVLVGPGAELVLTGVAAAVALAGRSRFAVRCTVADGGSLVHLPEPVVVTGRADHAAELHVVLGAGARLRTREVLVAGRSGEPPGRYRGRIRVDGPAGALLVQEQELGDPGLARSPAHLAGHRVLATEVRVGGPDPAAAVAGGWWSLVPLARGGCLATALAGDAVTAGRRLDAALAAVPTPVPPARQELVPAAAAKASTPVS